MLLCGIALAQGSPVLDWPTVGIESAAEASLLRGDLVAVGIKERTDLILRIVGVRRTEGGYRYDFRYIGLLPGDYNLAEYLLTPDGHPVKTLPVIPVKVLPLLPQGHQGELVSSRLKAYTPPGGYKLFFTGVWIFWAILLFPLLFACREKKPVVAETVMPPATLEELLRPLIDKALTCGLEVSEKEHLERLLMGYWQQALKLDEASAYRMLRKIKQHPEGGPLFEKLESWLHRPPGSVRVALDEVLAPYRNLAAAPEERGGTP